MESHTHRYPQGHSCRQKTVIQTASHVRALCPSPPPPPPPRSPVLAPDTVLGSFTTNPDTPKLFLASPALISTQLSVACVCDLPFAGPCPGCAWPFTLVIPSDHADQDIQNNPLTTTNDIQPAPTLSLPAQSRTSTLAQLVTLIMAKPLSPPQSQRSLLQRASQSLRTTAPSTVRQRKRPVESQSTRLTSSTKL